MRLAGRRRRSAAWPFSHFGSPEWVRCTCPSKRRELDAVLPGALLPISFPLVLPLDNGDYQMATNLTST